MFWKGWRSNMGFLLENGEVHYQRTSNGWKVIRREIGLKPTATLYKGLVFHKASLSFECNHCREKKPKNTRYLCGDYEKICVDCAVEWIEVSIKTFNELIDTLNQSKDQLLNNTDKWKKEQILGALIGEKK